MSGKQAILIAGPTASGKSGLALELAERFGGTVVNADSMQVYDGLRILTARPDAGDLARAPHRLYGHVDPRDAYSAGAYTRDCEVLLTELRGAAILPIFCGGTGLYFKALLGLLDTMPAVPDSLRQAWRRRLAEEGPAALHSLLVERDPAAAARIAPADGQRIVRALEIADVAGRPLSELQAGQGRPLIDGGRCVKIVLTPDRAVLRERIAQRFDSMVESGAMEEVRDFRRRFGAVGGTAGKAIGLAELGAVIDGQASLEAASERAIARTRQYAKRQETWFRHQFGPDWLRIPLRNVTEIAALEVFR
ncbi:tRNA (adenosine(37)-N6)-dimethylallyltransferase MiaA [Jiella sp. M17.18]|uniref:tRNA (adenosine(37)-N6)-dimethylallyltransferase MiaA n=1 Tax=Jiella sp. M17.18 TaxID=3234247 RepID=UPI0034DE52D3